MRRATVTAAATVLTTVLLAALAACAPAGGGAGADPPPTSVAPGSLRPLVPVTHPQITQYCPDVDAVHFDGDVASVDRVYVCTARELEPDEQSFPGTRQQAYRVLDFAALLEAYGAADSTTPADACIQSLADPLIVSLWRGDDRLAVYAPVDDCGFPTEAAATAYAAADTAKVQEAREQIDG